MILFRCCILTTLITTTLSAPLDIERTIQQVQNILQENSSLPRLNRDEILQLLNDIRSNDTNMINSTGNFKTQTENEIAEDENGKINQLEKLPQPQVVKENFVDENTLGESLLPSQIESTTKSATTLTVVLPYTPRDGSSLQELYTKPPRTEVVPVPKVTEKPNFLEKLNETLKNNAKFAKERRQEFPRELQAFLDSHGLKGDPEKDSFLLPLDGFKPLPSFKLADESVELPENILLTYDLISSSSELRAHADEERSLMQNEFQFEPLRPEFPFELDMSPSEPEEVSIPYDLPKKRKPKSVSQEHFDYDSVKVIPLRKGPNPVVEERNSLESDVNKRQTKVSLNEDEVNTTIITTSTSTETTSTQAVDSKDVDKASEAMSPSASDADTGASISDLEDSFGGSPPEKPGDSQLPPPKKNGFYWMLDWNSFLEVGDGRTKVNIHFEPKLGDPQMFIPVNVP